MKFIEEIDHQGKQPLTDICINFVLNFNQLISQTGYKALSLLFQIYFSHFFGEEYHMTSIT